MKHLLIFLTIVFFGTITLRSQELKPSYDSTLARKLGADDYGMKSYILVILKTGQKEIQEKATRDSLFEGHYKNIYRLIDQGKLIVAGTLVKNVNSYRGIFILNVTTFEEANELLQVDPTIKEGILDLELYKWYGSAALPEYLNTHKKIEKNQFK
jgi:hypothetical protein